MTTKWGKSNRYCCWSL